MSENKLTPEQMRTLTALTNRENAFRKGQAGPLEEHEQEWRLQAVMAITNGTELKDPYLPENLLVVPDPVATPNFPSGGGLNDMLETEQDLERPRKTLEKQKAGIVPDEEFNAMAAEDVENAVEPEMTDEEIEAEVRAAMTQALKDAGLWDEYQAAKEKHKEVWVNSSNGIIFGYRKLKFKDIIEAGELDNLMDEMKMVAERCVVLNKDELIGDDPSAYVYEMIYGLVRAVSNARPDMPYSVKV